jgi:hypothetical protein
MNAAFLLLAAFSLTRLSGCAPAQPEYEEINYPKLVLSEGVLEFGETELGNTVERTLYLSNKGEMVMGVGTIEIGPGYTENFAVSWDTALIDCPAVAVDSGTVEATALDSGGGRDTSPPKDSTSPDSGDVAEGLLFTLGPGCKIPLNVSFTPLIPGELYGALIVESVQAELTEEQSKSNELPDYLRDPYHWKQLAYLHGETDMEQGLVVVRPRSVDFGSVSADAGESVTKQIGISNVGNGDILLGGVTNDGCDPSFDLSFAPGAGTTLHAGETSLVEVTFTPDDSNAAYCELHVLSDDINNPDIDVSIRGNAGTDPDNEPPSVWVRSPDPGYRFSGIGTLTVELNLFDVNQPADTLICKIKSAVLQNVSVASCTPTDESGHVFVEIDADDLDVGVDTLLVTVTDASETTAYASTTVVIASEFPEGDDDGDGYDENTTPPDCDDQDRNTYPEAAELFDGIDNNCNSLIDEDTLGYDDDGDAFTEEDGDCNDYNEQAYPGAPERGDGVDNDCDGLVDEGTSLYDDDGDGYAEVNNDCDDRDPEISPAAIELCDGIDNDCDGVSDAADSCLATSIKPVVVGLVKPSQNACLSGEKIPLDAKIVDPDSQVLTYAWSDDSGSTTSNFDNPAAQAPNWTCPELPDGSGGHKYKVYVVAYDTDNNQVWTFEEISVYPADFTDLYEPYLKVTVTEQTGLCSTAGAASALQMMLVGAGAALIRRKRG